MYPLADLKPRNPQIPGTGELLRWGWGDGASGWDEKINVNNSLIPMGIAETDKTLYLHLAPPPPPLFNSQAPICEFCVSPAPRFSI